MKKVILILAILSLSCSKDNSTEPIEPINDGWTFYYRDSCDIYQASGSICLSENDYLEAMEDKVYVTNTCFKIKLNNVWYTWFGAVNVCN